MIEIRLYHGLIIVLLALASTVYADKFWTRLQRELSAKEDEKERDDDPELHDEDYAAWLENEIDEQITLLESIMGVSESLSVADAALGNLDEDFLDEILKAKLKRELTEYSETDEQVPRNPAKQATFSEKKGAKQKEDDLEQLLEMAVTMLGSMASESDKATSDDSRASKKEARKPARSYLDDRACATKCSGNFQRWIVYENGGFCKPTDDGECKGMWYQHREPADCIEVCLYAPSSQEKKLSIRLAASQPLSVDHYNETSPSS